MKPFTGTTDSYPPAAITGGADWTKSGHSREGANSTPAPRWPALSVLMLGVLCTSLPASAVPLLESDLASFTVLGAATVTNVPTSSVAGNVGVWAGSAITGFNSSPGVAVADLQVSSGLVHAGTALAQLAQAELDTAINLLGSLGAGTTLINPDLSGLTLFPGVYSVTAGTTNLSGSLTLDGQGNANAAWVFQMASTLITSPNSVVNMINTGAGAGVYWNVGSSATLDNNTTFLGNILALASITLNTGATDLCGRVLAGTGAVTLDQSSLSNLCMGELAGSDGLGGGLDVNGNQVGFLPFAPTGGTSVPEPASLALLGIGLAALAVRRRPKPA